eukprot:jgi/Chlat1/4747/Chrsp308S04737
MPSFKGQERASSTVCQAKQHTPSLAMGRFRGLSRMLFGNPANHAEDCKRLRSELLDLTELLVSSETSKHEEQQLRTQAQASAYQLEAHNQLLNTQLQQQQPLRHAAETANAALQNQLQLAYSVTGSSATASLAVPPALDRQFLLAQADAGRAAQEIADWVIDNADQLLPRSVLALSGDKDWVAKQWVQACLVRSYARFFEHELFDIEGASFLEHHAERAGRFQKYYSTKSSSGTAWPEVQFALDKWRYHSRIHLCEMLVQEMKAGEYHQANDIHAKLWAYINYQGKAVLGVWEDTLWKLHLLCHAFLVPPPIIRRTYGQVVDASDNLCQIINEPVAKKAITTRRSHASNVALMVFFGMSLGKHHTLPCQVVLMPAAEVFRPAQTQCAWPTASPALANQAVQAVHPQDGALQPQLEDNKLAQTQDKDLLECSKEQQVDLQVTYAMVHSNWNFIRPSSVLQ